MTGALIILSVLLACAVSAIVGYTLGQSTANAALRDERKLVEILHAENDRLRTKALELADEKIKGGGR